MSLRNLPNALIILGVLYLTFIYKFNAIQFILGLIAVVVAIGYWQYKYTDKNMRRLEYENKRLKNKLLELELIKGQTEILKGHIEVGEKHIKFLEKKVEIKEKKLVELLKSLKKRRKKK